MNDPKLLTPERFAEIISRAQQSHYRDANETVEDLLCHIDALDAATVPVPKYAELCAHHARHHEEEELGAPVRRALVGLEQLVRRFEKEPQGVGLHNVEQAMFAKLRELEELRKKESAVRREIEPVFADPSEELVGKWATSMQLEPFDSPVRAIGEVTLILLSRLSSVRTERDTLRDELAVVREHMTAVCVELAEAKTKRDRLAQRDSCLLGDAADAMGIVRKSDGVPLLLNWTHALAEMRALRESRDESDGEVDKLEDKLTEANARVAELVKGARNVVTAMYGFAVRTESEGLRQLSAANELHDAIAKAEAAKEPS